jgi:tripartite-type tricarboxylate transporter receptor subunit TctC
MRSVLVLISTLTVLFSMPAGGQLLGSGDKLRIIVPFAAGGVVDQIARGIGQDMSKALNATAVVENLSGAGGMIGTNTAAKSTPDGKTILLATSGTHIINPTLRGKAQEVAQAFEPIAFVGGVQQVLVVRKGLEAKSFAELIALGKSGQRLTFGSAGPGTTHHIAGEMVNMTTGTKAIHVPYRGLNPVMNDLVAGHVDFIVTSVIGVLPYVRDGSIRALAAFDSERIRQLPDVPTTAELGFKTLTMTNWFGLLVPVAVPKAQRDQLEKISMSIIRSNAMQERLTEAGVEGAKPAVEFRKLLDEDFARWPAILQTIGIKAE